MLCILYFVIFFFFFFLQGANNNRFLLAICASADVEVTFSLAEWVYIIHMYNVYMMKGSVSLFDPLLLLRYFFSVHMYSA